jgi:zinc transport system ATP-binding protein
MAQLSCKGLSLGYDGKVVAEGINFSVNAGDYLCVVGENGSGKSTLIKTLLKLMPPLSGNISAGDGLKHCGFGYIPQQSGAQKDFPASVREVVMSGLLNRRGLRPFYNSHEKKAAEDSMKKLGISKLAGRCYRELSGGQQQRALLARALCAASQILLLDEPAAGLDPIAAEEMYGLISRLNKSGLTIIMISHDIGASIKYASHILHIGNGKPLFFGTPECYVKNKIGMAYAGLAGEKL